MLDQSGLSLNFHRSSAAALLWFAFNAKLNMSILFIVLIVLAIVLSALGTIQSNIKLLGSGVILLEIALCLGKFATPNSTF